MSRATAASGVPTLAKRASRALEIAMTTLIAWAFGLVSAGVLLYVASGLWRGDYAVGTPLSAADPVMVSVGGVSREFPWGLTFVGKLGAAGAAGEAAIVMVALGMSMMFASNPRRLGLIALAFWAGLWAADGAILVGRTWNGAGFNAAVPVIAGAAALVLVFGCMIHRMFLLWRMRMVMM